MSCTPSARIWLVLELVDAVAMLLILLLHFPAYLLILIVLQLGSAGQKTTHKHQRSNQDTG